MTKSEACERYRIPLEILSEYESWGLCGAVRQIMGDCLWTSVNMSLSVCH